MEFKEELGELIRRPTDFTSEMRFPDASRIRLYDTTLRDGDQMPGVAFSPEHKYELAKRLSDIGAHIIDMGFPSVAASERRALQMLVKGKHKGEIREDLEILVMCRSNVEDIDITIKALEDVNVNPAEVTFFIFTSGSDLHIKYKIGKTLLKREGKGEEEWLELPVEFYREANIKMAVEAISYARDMGIKQIEFGGEDGSRSDVNYMIKLAKACYDAGGTRFSFPDTVGVFTPKAVEYYITKLVQAFPGKDLVVHFHNDFGFAAINTITAMSCGANIPTCTANGIGERAGNAPLHQVVMALKLLYGVEIPGFKYEKLRELREFIEGFSGIPVAVHEPIIGEGVFTHESGIHIAGLLIDESIYQVIPPKMVGAEMKFVFGKHSGYAAVAHILNKHHDQIGRAGVRITPEFVSKLTNFVKEVREKRSETGDLTQAVKAYYAAYKNLGISESHLIDIAISLGHVLQNWGSSEKT